MTHPIPQPPHERYSSKAFPPYRFVIGENPHPVSDPKGHSYGHEPDPQPLLAAKWMHNQDYLYAIDLYNYGYWWEAHETLEGLWGQFGKGSPESNLLQGLIKISAGFYKWHLQNRGGIMHHYAGGTALLREAMDHSAVYMGIDLPDYLARLEKHFKIVVTSHDLWPDLLAGYPFIDLKMTA